MPVISYSNKICFFHVYKTGGTTIRSLIKNSVKDFNIVDSLHGTVKESLKKHPYLRDFNTFSYVRCPYDWMFSLYNYIKMPIGHIDYKYVHDLDYNSFLTWVADVGMKRDEDCVSFYRTQTDFLFYKKSIFPKKIYKTEELCNDNSTSNVMSLFYNLGLDLPKEVPVLNKSNRPISWGEHYNTKTYKLINTIFKEDFKNFKYEIRNV
jgi:hypothetical protein